MFYIIIYTCTSININHIALIARSWIIAAACDYFCVVSRCQYEQ